MFPWEQTDVTTAIPTVCSPETYSVGLETSGMCAKSPLPLWPWQYTVLHFVWSIFEIFYPFPRLQLCSRFLPRPHFFSLRQKFLPIYFLSSVSVYIFLQSDFVYGRRKSAFWRQTCFQRKHSWSFNHKFTHSLTHSLTPWCRVFLEQLTGLQLVKEFPAFHGTRRFITALTSVRHLSLSWTNPYTHIPPRGDPS